MITKGQLKKDMTRLVEVAYQHLPETADRFFFEIQHEEWWLDSAVNSLPAICRVQAKDMVQAARDSGLSDGEICSLAFEAQREARSSLATAEEPARPLYSDELEALGYYYQI